jgi:hypothetical protein
VGGEPHPIDQRIEDACQRFGFRQSWRLWYHPRAWAEQRRPLVLSINPAAGGSGVTSGTDHGRYSQEAGSAFDVEDWGQRSLVKDPIPQYIQLAGLGVEDVAYVNWVPFRSPSSNDLTNHPQWREIKQWCRDLWRDLLSYPRCNHGGSSVSVPSHAMDCAASWDSLARSQRRSRRAAVVTPRPSEWMSIPRGRCGWSRCPIPAAG